jgi:hypothetical protein
LWSPGFRFAHSLFNQYVVSRVLQSYLVNCNVPQYSPFWGFLSLLLIFFVSLKVHLVPALRPSFSSPSVHSRTLFKSGLHSRFCVRFSVSDGAVAQLLLLRDRLRKTNEAVGQWRNRGRRNRRKKHRRPTRRLALSLAPSLINNINEKQRPRWQNTLPCRVTARH